MITKEDVRKQIDRMLDSAGWRKCLMSGVDPVISVGDRIWVKVFSDRLQK